MVTTGSGSDRPVSREEFEAAWPFLDRDTPKGQWKHISANTSYLEPIYDDMTSEARQKSSNGFDDHALAVGLLKQEVKDLTEELERLRSAGVGSSTGELTARAALRNAQREIVELRSELARVVEAARASEAAFEAQRTGSIGPSADVDQLRRDLALSKKGAEQAKSQLTELKKSSALTLGERDAEIVLLHLQVGDLKRSALAAPRVVEVAKLEVIIDIGGRRFGSVRTTDAKLASRLHDAAKSTLVSPNASIVESRQALELIADRLWEASFTGSRPRRLGQALDELRASPLIPNDDWHLFKNLWSRASAIVHDGGATVEMALWIWLGTMQLSELIVTFKRPATNAPEPGQ